MGPRTTSGKVSMKAELSNDSIHCYSRRYRGIRSVNRSFEDADFSFAFSIHSLSFFISLSPYFKAPLSRGIKDGIPDGCKVDQVSLMQRHGSRSVNPRLNREGRFDFDCSFASDFSPLFMSFTSLSIYVRSLSDIRSQKKSESLLI